MIPVEKLESLPLFHRETIPTAYLDAMGYMNVQWYVALFDKAAWTFSAASGLDREYFETQKSGAFALRQFI